MFLNLDRPVAGIALVAYMGVVQRVTVTLHYRRWTAERSRER